MTDSREDEEDDGGPPRNCSGCRKPVLDGQGLQVETEHRIKRFCAKCFLKECDKNI